MRISTNMLFSQGGTQISNLQSQVTTTQAEISAGTSLLTPADNPAAAAQSMDVYQQQSMNTQFTSNRQMAETTLNMTGSALSSMTTLLRSVKSLVVSAGDPTLTAADRSNIATQIQNDYSSLLALANSTDGNGNYLFGGYKNSTPPFVQTTGASGTPSVQYLGDQGQTVLQVGPSQQVTVSTSGQAMLQSGGQDIFATLSTLTSLLNNSNVSNATLTQGLSGINDSITQTLNKVINASSVAGSSLSQLQALDTVGSNLDVQYSQTLSNLQSLDYAKTISQLSEQTTTLQAAQMSFVKIENLSLFNYIN